MELRELKSFVAVVEESGMSAAARRLHVSQSALSQTINSLERELGVKLLVRSSAGVRPTPAGMTLLGEARAVLARYAQAVRTMADHTTEGGCVIRLGIPVELPPSVLPATLSRFAADCPLARIVPGHMATAAQLAALRSDDLDVGLVRERPAGSEFDAIVVCRERLGILIASDRAAELSGPDGISLEALRGMDWVGFPRNHSPAWYDELAAIFCTHGIALGPSSQDDQELIPAVKLMGVGASAGRAFALAPPDWPHPIPDGIRWEPLVGHPFIRRTWVIWPADSRRREVSHLVAAFEIVDF